MSKLKIDNQALVATASNYCYMRGEKAVFLDRKDKDIAVFDSYDEAHKCAIENIHPIDGDSK